MSMIPDRLLRQTLRANAIFSAAGGVITALFAKSLASLMTPATEIVSGLPVSTVLVILGLGLVLFGIAVGIAAGQKELSQAIGQAIFWADVAWVLGTCVLLVLAAPVFTLTGLILVIGVGLVVADFAAFEYWGLRRLRIG